MVIGRWMQKHVITVRPRDSIVYARRLMEEHRVNQLPVVVDDRLVGIVTDRDLRDAFPSVFEVRRARRARGTDPASIVVEDVMSANVLTLDPDTDVREGARLMRRERIGSVPVVQGQRLVGILTRSDLLDAFLSLERGVV
jgi:acetoin utilization protein AcuB